MIEIDKVDYNVMKFFVFEYVRFELLKYVV